ncbi:MAG: hypothetical protein ABI718_03070 [Acidobacteriota bacterium]
MSVANVSAMLQRCTASAVMLLLGLGVSPVFAQSEDPAAHTAPAVAEASASPSPSPAPEDTSAGSEIQPGTAPAAHSDLVKAARKGRGTKVRVSLTNKDVKESKGKLTLISSSKLPEETVKPAPPHGGSGDADASKSNVQPKSVAVKTVAEPKKLATAEARLDRAKREVADLERELARNEQQYYSEDDASYRDQVIRPRFDRTRVQLEKARSELSSARDDLQSLQ